ncbi:MAG: glycosyltransferase [Roseococcus sp.]|nr:glycosyltransferase [Roseococcus sp.]
MARLCFVLPVGGGGGGAHSVVQEVNAMRDLGIEAQVLVNRRNAESFLASYERFPWVTQGGMAAFEGSKDLATLLMGAEVVVATTNTSAYSIADALPGLRGQGLRPGYYVQDYEPLFYAAGTTEHAMAVASYAVLPGCTYFAKTRWLAGMVEAAHGHATQLVVPSIDHGIYRPAPRPAGQRRLVAAMVRPSTPRRAPRRTLRMLARLASGEFGPVALTAFGCTAEELEEAGLALPEGVTLLGRLRQVEVAELLRATDAFLDLSDYQGFGRTAAEAMACGAVVLAPSLGGAVDFITDGVSGFLAPTTDDAAVAATIRRMLSLSEAELRAMRLAALEAVSGYTPVRAAISELRALGLG